MYLFKKTTITFQLNPHVLQQNLFLFSVSCRCAVFSYNPVTLDSVLALKQPLWELERGLVERCGMKEDRAIKSY